MCLSALLLCSLRSPFHFWCSQPSIQCRVHYKWYTNPISISDFHLILLRFFLCEMVERTSAYFVHKILCLFPPMLVFFALFHFMCLCVCARSVSKYKYGKMVTVFFLSLFRTHSQIACVIWLLFRFFEISTMLMRSRFIWKKEQLEKFRFFLFCLMLLFQQKWHISNSAMLVFTEDGRDGLHRTCTHIHLLFDGFMRFFFRIIKVTATHCCVHSYGLAGPETKRRDTPFLDVVCGF